MPRPSAVAVIAVLALPAAAAHGTPIAPGRPSVDPAFTGAAATAQRATPTIAPQNPFLAKNPNNNIHNDTWMTDAYTSRPGPLGSNPDAFNGAYQLSVCGSLTFDKKGHIVSVCPSTLYAPQARIIDPDTLEVLASYDLPTAPDPPGTKQYQNFTGGGYFFLDQKDRMWSATKTSHLFVLSEDGTSFTKIGDYDLTKVLNPDERVTSALPDFKGHIWFVSKKDGKVGILDPRRHKVTGVLTTHEEIENSFAVDKDAIYIASDKRMYRFSERHGKPHVDWKVTYRNSGIVKPSQVDAGTGTTPTIMKGGLVTITDNADPMNVVVYRTAKKLRRGQKRTVCQVPVFDKGKSATENSEITAGRSIVVENNYGYQDPLPPSPYFANPVPTVPGYARVDVNKKGTGCRKVWTNADVASPTVVPKLSDKTGLIYGYAQDFDSAGNQRWDWAAISFKTGKTVWKQLAGTGYFFNNNYGGLALGPTGTAYLGTIGGMVALKDG